MVRWTESWPPVVLLAYSLVACGPCETPPPPAVDGGTCSTGDGGCEADCLAQCPDGFACQADRCLEAACEEVTCGPDTRCGQGACYPVACGATPCPFGYLCSTFGECTPPSCALTQCPPSETCSGGTCYPVQCLGTPCPPFHACIGDKCVEAACAGVVCPQGFRCGGGTCLSEDCAGASCGALGQVCDQGQCVDPLCKGVACPNGVCQGGLCQPVCNPGGCNDGGGVDGGTGQDGGFDGGVDGGRSWSCTLEPLVDGGLCALSGLCFDNPSYPAFQSLAAGGPGEVTGFSEFGSLRGTGSAWSLNSPPPVVPHAAWGNSASDHWALADGGVFHFDGSGWSAVNTPAFGPYAAVWGEGPSEAWVSGNGRHARWNGVDWSYYDSQGKDWRAVHGVSPSAVFAAGAHAALGVWNGTSWYEIETPASPVVLHGVWASGPTNAWAVGEQGVLFHWVGTGWTLVPSPVQVTLRSVWGAHAADVWVGGEGGTLIHWNGVAWSESCRSTDEAILEVRGTGSDDVWARTSTGQLLEFDGTRWAPLFRTKVAHREHLRTVWGASESDVWAASDRTLWRRQTGGWSSVPVEIDLDGGAYLDVWADGVSGHVWAVGTGGLIARTTDGQRWSTFRSPTEKHLTAVSGSSASNVFAAGQQGTLIRWNGTNWALVGGSPTNQDFNDLFTVGAGAIVVSNGGFFDVATPSGLWIRLTLSDGGYPDPGKNLMGVWGTAATDFWVVGSGGYVIRCLGPFPTCTESTLPQGANLYTVHGSPAGGVWAAGAQYTYHFDGGTWTPYLPSASVGLWVADVWSAGESDAWGASFFGDLMRWNGVSWSDVSRPGQANFGRFSGTASTDLWLVGGTDRSHWNGSGWEPRNDYSSSGEVRSLFGLSATDVWAVGDSTAHWNGSTWREVTRHGAQLNSLWGTGSTDLWGVGPDGGIHHWDGLSWSGAASGTSIDLHGISGRGPTEVWAVGRGGETLFWGGGGWTRKTTSVTADLNGVWVSPALDVFAASDAGAIVQWAGNDWQEVASTSAPVSSISGSSSTDVWAIGRRGGLWSWNGSTWEKRPAPAVDFSAIHALPGGAWFAVGQSGTVIRRTP